MQVEHPRSGDEVADLFLVVGVLVEELRPGRRSGRAPLIGVDRMQLRDIDEPVAVLGDQAIH